MLTRLFGSIGQCTRIINHQQVVFKVSQQYIKTGLINTTQYKFSGNSQKIK